MQKPTGSCLSCNYQAWLHQFICRQAMRYATMLQEKKWHFFAIHAVWNFLHPHSPSFKPINKSKFGTCLLFQPNMSPLVKVCCIFSSIPWDNYWLEILAWQSFLRRLYVHGLMAKFKSLFRYMLNVDIITVNLALSVIFYDSLICYASQRTLQNTMFPVYLSIS